MQYSLCYHVQASIGTWHLLLHVYKHRIFRTVWYETDCITDCMVPLQCSVLSKWLSSYHHVNISIHPWMQQIDIIANINSTKMLQTFNIALHWSVSCQFSEVDSTKNVLICPRLVQVSQTDVSSQFFQSAATRPSVFRLHVSEAKVCPHLSRSNKIMCLHSVCTIRY